MHAPSESINIVCPHCNSVNRVLESRIEDGPRCGKCKGQLFEGKPVHLDEGNFDRQTSRNDIPVVVDFWAPWCGPCRMMAPAFVQAAGELEPRVRLAKLNTEEAQSIAARFDIRSIPTTMVFRDGREVARQPGAMDLGRLMQWLRPYVG